MSSSPLPHRIHSQQSNTQSGMTDETYVSSQLLFPTSVCVCVCIVGQQRLQIDYQGLTDRVVKAEKQHASLASQLQQSASCQNQIKASLRNVQRQAGTAESGQAKLQQEVTDLGQAVEQVKGRKGPALPWQRSQEQVLLLLCVGSHLVSTCRHLGFDNLFGIFSCYLIQLAAHNRYAAHW